MRSSALSIVPTCLTVSYAAAETGNFRSTLTEMGESYDNRAAFFSRCAALARNFRSGETSKFWLGEKFRDLVEISGTQFEAETFSEGPFLKRAKDLSFKASGHEWEHIWQDSKVNGALPFWATSLIAGVDEMTQHNAIAYKSLISSASSNQDNLDFLTSELLACERANER